MDEHIQKLLPLGAKQTEEALKGLSKQQLGEMIIKIINELEQFENHEKTAPLVCLIAVACVRLGTINQRGKSFEPNIFQQ